MSAQPPTVTLEQEIAAKAADSRVSRAAVADLVRRVRARIAVLGPALKLEAERSMRVLEEEAAKTP